MDDESHFHDVLLKTLFHVITYLLYFNSALWRVILYDIDIQIYKFFSLNSLMFFIFIILLSVFIIFLKCNKKYFQFRKDVALMFFIYIFGI